MNFSVSSLLSFLFVLHTVNILGPLPAKVKNQVARYQSTRYAVLEEAMSEPMTTLEQPAAVKPSYLGITELPAKPLLTFEKYIASRKQKRTLARFPASVGKAKKSGAIKSASQNRPTTNRVIQ
ncbi:hypothetical protein ACLVWU_08840 [Bdellovibrio sp. HCB290]|uniref:hypothetical protein n=1 Tax=Bdellovibrio sp. HCB290 TaxID=3394356 RepID=UPI0039B6A985